MEPEEKCQQWSPRPLLEGGVAPRCDRGLPPPLLPVGWFLTNARDAVTADLCTARWPDFNCILSGILQVSAQLCVAFCNTQLCFIVFFQRIDLFEREHMRNAPTSRGGGGGERSSRQREQQTPD